MRPIIFSFALLLSLVGSASAQSFQGNWACKQADMPTGILTIYGSSYGFASLTFGDARSGTGTIDRYSDGVGFVDGPLVSAGGLSAGRIIEGVGAPILQLESQSAIEMACSTR